MRNTIRWAMYLYTAFGIAMIVAIVYVFGDFIEGLSSQ